MLTTESGSIVADATIFSNSQPSPTQQFKIDLTTGNYDPDLYFRLRNRSFQQRRFVTKPGKIKNVPDVFDLAALKKQVEALGERVTVALEKDKPILSGALNNYRAQTLSAAAAGAAILRASNARLRGIYENINIASPAITRIFDGENGKHFDPAKSLQPGERLMTENEQGYFVFVDSGELALHASGGYKIKATIRDEDITHYTSAYVELDGAPLNDQIAIIVEMVERGALPLPSAVLFSGNRSLQIFWFLADEQGEPIARSTENDAAWERVQAAISGALNAQYPQFTNAKGKPNLADTVAQTKKQLLRVPGYNNVAFDASTNAIAATPVVLRWLCEKYYSLTEMRDALMLNAAPVMPEPTSPPVSVSAQVLQPPTNLVAYPPPISRSALERKRIEGLFRRTLNDALTITRNAPDGEKNNLLYSSARNVFERLHAYADVLGAQLNSVVTQLAAATQVETQDAAATIKSAQRAAESSPKPFNELLPEPDEDVDTDTIVDFPRHEIPDFPLDLLPPFFQKLVKLIAASVNQHAAMPFYDVVSGLSSIIGHCSYIAASGATSWIEPVNVYTINIGPVGDKKSAIKSHVFRAIRAAVATRKEEVMARLKIEREERKKLRKAVEIAEKDLRDYDNLIRAGKSLPPHLNGLDVPKRRAWVAEQEQYLAQLPPLVDFERFGDDATAEGLGKALLLHDERFAIASGEGHIFDVLSGLYGGRPNLNLALKGYSRESTSTLRSGDFGKQQDADEIVQMTRTLHAPCLTFSLGTQPETLQRMVGKNRSLVFSGLLPRFFPAFPVRPAPLPLDEQDSICAELHSAIAGWEQHVQRLFAADVVFPNIFNLTEAGTRYIREIDRLIQGTVDQDDDLLSPIRDWAVRIPGHTLRLSFYLHLMEHLESGLPVEEIDTVIPDKTLKNAHKLILNLVFHVRRTWGIFEYTAPAVADAKTAIDDLRTFKKREDEAIAEGKLDRAKRVFVQFGDRWRIGKRDLIRHVPIFRKASEKNRNEAIQMLIDRGFCQPVQIGKKVMLEFTAEALKKGGATC